MKITKIEAIPVRIPKDENKVETRKLYSNVSWDRCVYSCCYESLFVRIETDEGLIGWGEALAPVTPEVPALIIERLLSDILIGKDPLENDVLYNCMYHTMFGRKTNTGFMLDAIAACDTALWDLKGKILNQPVWKLLGGRYRDKIPVYVSGIVRHGFKDDAEAALDYMSKGFKAFKGIPLDYSFREKLGPDAILLYDGLWRYSFDEAITVARKLREMDAAFFECPLAPEALDDHKRLREITGMPIAIGEAERTRFEFLEIFMKNAADFIQPDIGRTGITELAAIANLARAFNRRVAPHESMGMGICIAASIHICASIPNLYMLEYKELTTKLANEFLDKPLKCEAGYFEIPDGPGLGVEPDYEKLIKYKAE